MSQQPLHADPLSWGHGPRTFEVFLEPTCPFSVRAFNKLDALLNEVGEEKVTVKIRLQSQPWHMFSGVIVRCILAASTLPEGKAAARSVLKAVADHREEFEFTDHCSGPNMHATPQQIIERIEQYSGVKLAAAFARNCKPKSNGTANMRGRTAFTYRRPLWSTGWCRPISAAAMTSASGRSVSSPETLLH